MSLPVYPTSPSCACLTCTNLPVCSSRPLPCRMHSANRGARRYVVWSRIDQKTCLKSIVSANLLPVVIEPKQQGDALVTDCDAMEAAVQQLGGTNVACIVTTTSCFAPRNCDDVRLRATRCTVTQYIIDVSITSPGNVCLEMCAQNHAALPSLRLLVNAHPMPSGSAVGLGCCMHQSELCLACVSMCGHWMHATMGCPSGENALQRPTPKS